MAELDKKELLKQAEKRLNTARAERALQEPWMRSAYRYCLPYRRRFDETTVRPQDQDDLFETTGQETHADFAAQVTHTFTPSTNQWIDVEPIGGLPIEKRQEITKLATRVKSIVFDLIRESNFYMAAPEAHLDLGVSTACMIIDDVALDRPVVCRSIPITQLYMTRGPWGTVGTSIYWEDMTPEQVKATWPKADMPKQMTGKGCEEKVFRVWCAWWRDWSDNANESYFHIVWCSKDVIAVEKRVGRGSCAIIVARWTTDPCSPWGIGPANAALANIRTLDELCFLSLRALEKRTDPPTFYDDDTEINIDNGVEAGQWIAQRSGTRPPQPMQYGDDMDAAIFEKNDLKRAIRRTYFQDYPEQEGKTPPTAAQWMDEAARNARRMGSPVGRTVVEWQLPIFDRFARIALERGLIKAEELAALWKSAKPTSPLLRAQQQEEALVSINFMSVIRDTAGPEALQSLVKLIPTFQHIKEAMQDKGVELKTEAEVMADLEAMARIQALANQPAAGGGGGALPAPG